MSVEARLGQLLREWDVPSDETTDPWQLVDAALGPDPDSRRLWQLYVVTLLEYPNESAYRAFSDDVRLYGAAYAAGRAEARRPEPEDEAPPAPSEIRFVSDVTWVDVNDTSRSDRTTGVQRVVRETARRWSRSNGARLVAWNATERNLDGTYLRELDDVETGLFLADKKALDTSKVRPLLVPTSGRVIIAEVTTDVWRAGRTAALARHSGLQVGFIVYDLVPFTAGDTSTPGIAGQFPLYLEAVAQSKRVVTISHAAYAEYKGWKRMLPSVGVTGPELGVSPLATEAAAAPKSGFVDVHRRAGVAPGKPIVLVVGSHEPRKNHLAVLHAAERLWREGRSFSLVFIGGVGWKNDQFLHVARQLKRARRPLALVKDADDALLAAAYRAARFTVFPSLHEGFGLPVAESLASGTPTVTSNFGSTKEIVEETGGALLIDPRDDEAIVGAMRDLLSDDELLARLRAEAANMPVRTWDDYAADAWQFLTAEA